MKRTLSKTDLAMIEAKKRGYFITKKGDVYGMKGEILKKRKHPHPTVYPYYFFTIRVDGISRRVFNHRLQAYTKFKDKVFEKGIITRHGKGGSLDNSWDNINIGTHQQNMMDKPAKQRRKDASSPIHDHSEIIKLHKENGLSYAKIGDKYGISRGTISYIINKSLAAEEYYNK